MSSAILSRAAQLGMMILVARQLGPSDYGQFVFATSTAMVASMFGNLGWQLSFNRFFAVARRQEDLGELRALMQASSRVNFAGGFMAGLVLAIASLFTQRLGFGLMAAAVLTIPSTVTLLRRQQLAATRQVAYALMLDQGFASIVLLGFVLIARLSLFQMLAVYAAALAFGNLVAVALVRRRLPADINRFAPRFDIRTWMRVSLTLLQASMARLLLSRIDSVLLPVLSTLTATGLYGAAFRVTYVLTYPQFVLQTLNGPQFAEAFAGNQIGRARRILKLSIAFSLVTSLPWLALFVGFPRFIMTLLFGSAYGGAAWPLVLVSIGQFAMSMAAPFNTILIMSGNERSVARVSYSLLAGSLALAFVLIAPFGATGAATVIMLSGLGLLVSQVWLCRIPLREGFVPPAAGTVSVPAEDTAS